MHSKIGAGINNGSGEDVDELDSMSDSGSENVHENPTTGPAFNTFNILTPTEEDAAELDYGQHQQGGRVASSAIDDIHTQIPIHSSLMDIHNSRFRWFSRCRLFSVAIIIISLFIYRIVLLSDISNITTTTSLESISEIEVPYIIFRPTSSKILPAFYYIKFINANGKIDYELRFSDIELYQVFYINDTLYIRNDEDVIVPYLAQLPSDQWARIYISNFEEDINNRTDDDFVAYVNSGAYEVLTEILIPPKSLKMNVEHTMEVAIISFSHIIHTDHATSHDLEDYIRSMANGLNHGIMYYADNTQLLEKFGINAVQEIMKKFSNSSSFFALPAQNSYVFMQHNQVIDDTHNGRDKTFYLLSTGLSYFQLENAEIELGCGTLCDRPTLLTKLHFVAHPAFIKYVIRWHYIFDVWNVFANVGGILSVLLTITAVLLVWFTWGVGFYCCRGRFYGVAPSAGFDDVFKQKLDAYLAGRGLTIVNKD